MLMAMFHDGTKGLSGSCGEPLLKRLVYADDILVTAAEQSQAEQPMNQVQPAGANYLQLNWGKLKHFFYVALAFLNHVVLPLPTSPCCSWALC